MRPTAIRALIVVGLLGAGCTDVCAADVQTSSDRLCAYKLAGQIIAGDYDKLTGLIARSHPDIRDGERAITLCLKSNGGSYGEGLKLAELVYKSGFSTLVADGSECFSACAIVFMAGVIEKQIAPYRKLSAGGILGFHAPYLSVDSGTYSKEAVEGATQEMRLVLITGLRLGETDTPILKPFCLPPLDHAPSHAAPPPL